MDDIDAQLSATSAKTLRGGTIPHRLTTEDRRKGALHTNEIRRQKREEARKTATDRLAETLEGHAADLATRR